ncbi:TetR/AcrR family transcriptional regulator [Roseovarius amoyensis]|uniref:TetR/AcrR family transcriptional regulator n=1 Tax=Roseovarius amoyensis TaxID=2211448 RepID=UPI000DBE0A52|nr:TetR/AcrR family transcriptional regulator [Roseovarius amoyensis]
MPKQTTSSIFKLREEDAGGGIEILSAPNVQAEGGGNSIRDELHLYRRQRILSSAAELFSQKGYSGALVGELAKKIGVTKPFIYYYMKNKQDILEQICTATIDLPHLVMDEVFSEDLSPTDSLHTFVRRFATVQGINQNYVSVFFREELNLSPVVRQYVIGRRREFDERLEKLLRKGVETEDFRVSDVPLTARAIAGMVCWIFNWYQPEGRLSIEDVSQLFAELTLNMVDARRRPDQTV